MAQAFPVVLKQGSPTMEDYRPTVNVDAGDVVIVGASPRVAQRDIPANDLGALAMFGGTYVCTGNAAIADGAKVFFDPATSKMTTTAGSLKAFGESVSACAADGSQFLVFHNPGTL